MATTTVTETTVDSAERDRIEDGGTVRTPAGAVRHTPAEPAVNDLRIHERDFNGFITFLIWNVVAIAAVLVFLALANA